MDSGTHQNWMDRNILTPIQSYSNQNFNQDDLNNLESGVSSFLSPVPNYGNINFDFDQMTSNLKDIDQYYTDYTSKTTSYPDNAIFMENKRKTIRANKIIRPKQFLPTKYLPTQYLTPKSDIKGFAEVNPINDYNKTANIESNPNIVQQINEYYTPNTNVSYSNQEFNQIKYQTQEETQTTNYDLNDILGNNTNDINNMVGNTTTNINDIIYNTTTTDYNNIVDNATTNDFNKNEDILAYFKSTEDNPTNTYNNIIDNDINKISVKEIAQIPQETTTKANPEVVYNLEPPKENNNYEINIPIQNKFLEENFHSHIHQSPNIEIKNEVFSPLHSPLSNFDTQSYNQDMFIKTLENEKEPQNSKAENEALKKQMIELDKIKTEANVEISNIKKEDEQFSPRQEQGDEIISLKSQLAELNELKTKLEELEKLRVQIEQITSLKKQKLKSLVEKEEKQNQNQISANTEIKKETIEEPPKQEETKEVKVVDTENNNTIVTEEKAEEKQEIKENKEDKEIKEDKEDKEKTNKSLEDKPEQTFVNGDIIHSLEELEMLIRKINKSSKRITLNLIYKATADSDKAEDFHRKCDEAKNTLVLIETDKGKRFGGYTSVDWKGKCVNKKDENAFIFSLDKMKIYESIPGKNAIACYPKCGPVFSGCQIRIYDNAFQRGGTTFKKGVMYKTTENFELNGGERTFKVKDVEVYEVIPQ